MNKHIYFTVGPTQPYPTVIKHLEKALKDELISLNHRSPSFEQLFFDTSEKLRMIFHIPTSTNIFFIGSALEGMERTIQNSVDKKSFHIVHGEFSKKFYQFSLDYGKKPTKIEVLPTQGFSKKLVIPKDIELIALTHNETSTGTMMTNDDILTLHKKAPQALIAIDMVSSVPCVPIDFSIIDIAFFSVQKGFGLPAGMGILMVNKRALEKATKLQQTKKIIGSYHNFISLLEKATIGQTPETPNVLSIYLLNRVCQDMLSYGIMQIQKDTRVKADLLYGFFDKHPDYQSVVKDKDVRSLTTIVIDVKGKSETIRKKLSTKGLIISSGYGPYKKDQVRIGNFPSHSTNDIQKLLSAIQNI